MEWALIRKNAYDESCVLDSDGGGVEVMWRVHMLVEEDTRIWEVT